MRIFIVIRLIVLLLMATACSSRHNATAQSSPERYSSALKQEIADTVRLRLPKNYTKDLLHYKDSSDVVYSVQPLWVRNHWVFEVEGTFVMDSIPACYLSLYTYPGLQRHDSLIRNVEVFVTADSTEPARRTPSGWLIERKAFSRVFFRYTVVQDSLSACTEDVGSSFAALLFEKYFILHRNALFLIPVDVGIQWLQNKGSMTILWKSMPKTWQWSNTFGQNDSVQIIRGRSYQFVSDALFVGGEDVIVKDTTLASGKLLLAGFKNVWKFPTEQMLHTTTRIIAAEREWMQSATITTYQAVLSGSPGLEKEFGIGHAYPSTFIAFLSEQADSATDAVVKHTIAHEVFHTWNFGLKVKYNPVTASNLYFLEGFTEYCSRKLLLKSGLITQKEYIELFNRSLRRYQTSPYKTVTANSIVLPLAARSYTAPARLIAYWKGDILAHNWNQEIERYTKGKYSFEDVYRQALQSEGLITDSSLVALMKPYIGRDVMPDIMGVIRDGQYIEPHPEALGHGVGLKSVAFVESRFIIPISWSKVLQYYIKEP
jgi:predicted metalloprotease with PDZ domain